MLFGEVFFVVGSSCTHWRSRAAVTWPSVRDMETRAFPVATWRPRLVATTAGGAQKAARGSWGPYAGLQDRSQASWRADAQFLGVHMAVEVPRRVCGHGVGCVHCPRVTAEPCVCDRDGEDCCGAGHTAPEGMLNAYARHMAALVGRQWA